MSGVLVVLTAHINGLCLSENLLCFVVLHAASASAAVSQRGPSIQVCLPGLMPLH